MHQSGVSIEPTPEIVTGTLRMLQDRLLIKPLDWNGEQVHGADSRIIVMRDGRPVRGTVVAVGPGRHPFIRKGRTNDGRHTRVTESKRFQPTEVKVGDVVELGGLNQYDGKGYQFQRIVYNGEPHLICSERDVCGVRE